MVHLAFSFLFFAGGASSSVSTDFRPRAGKALPCAPRLRLSPDPESTTAAVRNLRRDLDAAIHRPGMHDDRVRRGAFEMSRMQTVVNGVLAHRRKERRVLSLALDSQDHHHVRAVDRVFKMFFDAQAAFHQLAELVPGTSVPGPPTLTFAPSFVSR